jgi:hypothetical protein
VKEFKTIIKMKKDSKCECITIDDKLDESEHTLGLLDAAFAYLNVPCPNDKDRKNASEAASAPSNQWRKLGCNITLKTHIMEKYVCELNNKFGIGDN